MTEERDDLAAQLQVVSGDPTDAEVAAITVVLTTVLDELAAEHERNQEAGVSAWAKSQRNLRGTLRPGPGAWRGFSG